MNQLQFILDMHCHTSASDHGYSTLEENLTRAREIGLKLVGISDHGPAMSDSPPLSHFMDILKLPSVICKMPWLKGTEANIIDCKGGLDIPDDILSDLDFCIASIHSSLFLPGDAEKNTAAVIGVMNNPNVNIIGHLGDCRVPINIKPIITAAKKTGTIIEINNKSLIPDTRRYDGGIALWEILGHCKEQGVPIIAGSDAHVAKHVGRLKLAKKLIKKSGIDESLVMNTSVENFTKNVRSKNERSIY